MWGLRYVDDLVLRDRATSGSTFNERLYALQDANWNVVAIYNASANAVAERFAYTAYGVVLALNPTDFSFPYTGTDYDWTVLYTGRALDDESGLYYYRMRYYHPVLGVFVSRDQTPADLSRYAYCGKNPVNYVDPTGLQAKPGTAVCGGQPTGVVTIAGRGSFGILTLNDRYSEGDWYSRLGSDFYALWHWKPGAFVDATGKCCCCEVGFIQVVASDASYNGRLPVAPKNWRVDRSDWLPGVVYQNQATKNPCDSTLISNITMTDAPNAPAKSWGYFGSPLADLWQRFETCAVCLDGPEGANIKSLHAGKSIHKTLLGVTVYGCISWEHHIYWDPATGKYVYERTVEGAGTLTGGASAGISTPPPAPPVRTAPSPNWTNAVVGHDWYPY